MALKDDWDDVYSSVFDAKGIAFDGCHKIYVLMDDKQIEQMREYEYEFVLTKDDLSDAEMYQTLQNWFEESCSLKFIQAITSVPEGEDENDGFETLIDQFAQDDCEECYNRLSDCVCDEDYDDEDEDEE